MTEIITKHKLLGIKYRLTYCVREDMAGKKSPTMPRASRMTIMIENARFITSV